MRKRQEEREARRRRTNINQGLRQRVLSVFGPNTNPWTTRKPTVTIVDSAEWDNDTIRKTGKLKISMIRRMSNAPQRVNPAGHITELRSEAPAPIMPENYATNSAPAFINLPKSMLPEIAAESPSVITIRQSTADEVHSAPEPTTNSPLGLTECVGVLGNVRRGTREVQEASSFLDDRGTSTAIHRIQTIPRTQTVEFALARPTRTRSPERGGEIDSPTYQSNEGRRLSDQGDETTFQNRAYAGLEHSVSNQFPRTATGVGMKHRGSMHTGFGGFPTPYRLLIKVVSWMAPVTAERIRLRLTVPRTPSIKLKPAMSIASQTIDAALRAERKMVSEDIEFLGGVEYRSLKLLRLIVILVGCIVDGERLTYHICIVPCRNSSPRLCLSGRGCYSSEMATYIRGPT